MITAMEIAPFQVGLPGLGASGLVVLCVLMILTGRLIVKSRHEFEVGILMKDRDEWRETAKIAVKTQEVQASQIAELLQYARTANTVLTSLPKVAEHKET